MKAIELPTQSELNEAFTYADGKIYWAINKQGVTKGKVAMCRRKDGYCVTVLNQQLYLSHRIIWTMLNGEIPEGLLVDHINGIAGDDRIENLQLVTNQQNLQKQTRKKNADSGYKGTYLHKASNKYAAQISIESTVTHLGLFNTVEEAAIAYDEAAILNYKEFAMTNFPKENYIQ